MHWILLIGVYMGFMKEVLSHTTVLSIILVGLQSIRECYDLVER